MLQLTSRIIIITNKDTRTPGQSPILSYDFAIPNSSGPKEPNLIEFKQKLDAGEDISFHFDFVNDIEINSSFKNLTKTAKITLPRNLRYDNLTLINDVISDDTTSLPMFSIGDRIIIQCGYIVGGTSKNSLKEVFRGYITNINIGVPTIIECQDKMFLLKRMLVKYPDTQDLENGSYTNTKSKISLNDLLKRIFVTNRKLPQGANNIFKINGTPKPETVLLPMENNTRNFSDMEIPIITPITISDTSFTYTTDRVKTVAEVLVDIKNKTGIISYFDDFGNLHFELPYMNSLEVKNSITRQIPIDFEKQIIETNNLKYQKDYETAIKVIYSSKQTSTVKKTKGTVLIGTDDGNPNKGFIGDPDGDIITVNAPDDISQEECNRLGKYKYFGEKYTGYVKGSTFTTFGEPSIYMGRGVNIKSTKYPERNGAYFVNGVKRTFGVNGFRQTVELGVNLDTYTYKGD